MKKLLFFSLLGLSAGLLAQPVMTAADHMSVGEGYTSYSVINPAGLDTTITGPNAVWNYAGLTSSGSDEITFVNPNTQPGFSNFSDATLAYQAVTAGGATTYTFFNLNNSEWALNGIYVAGASPTVINYQPNLPYMVFPFTYNTNINSTLQATTLANGITIYREGTQNLRYDGYGTLTTPDGTFQDVIRYRIEQTFIDSFFIQGTTSITNYHSISFIWTNAERGLAPLLSWAVLESDFGPSVTAYWVDPGVLSASNVEKSSPTIVAPNPASKQFSINQLDPNTPAQISVIDLSGRIVHEQTSTGSVAPVYVPQLHAGVYMVRVQTADKTEMHRIVLQ